MWRRRDRNTHIHRPSHRACALDTANTSSSADDSLEDLDVVRLTRERSLGLLAVLPVSGDACFSDTVRLTGQYDLLKTTTLFSLIVWSTSCLTWLIFSVLMEEAAEPSLKVVEKVRAVGGSVVGRRRCEDKVANRTAGRKVM
jgi:hypothetical protein